MIREELLLILLKFGWIQNTSNGYMLTVNGIENYLVWNQITENKFDLYNEIKKQFNTINEKKFENIKNNLIANKMLCSVWSIKLGREVLESTKNAYDLFETMSFYTNQKKQRNAKIKQEFKTGISELFRALQSMQANQKTSQNKQKKNIHRRQNRQSRQNMKRNYSDSSEIEDLGDYSSLGDDFKKWGKL